MNITINGKPFDGQHGNSRKSPRRLPWLVAAVLAVLSHNAHAEMNWKLVEAASVPLPAQVPGKVVCSGYDATVCSNIEHFYKFKSMSLWKFSVVGIFTENWGLRASLTTGAKSEKLVIDPRLVLGIIRSHAVTKHRIISTEIYNSFGGESRNKPCIDSYDREYYCGNLTAWSDYPKKQVPFHEYGIKVVYSF